MDAGITLSSGSTWTVGNIITANGGNYMFTPSPSWIYASTAPEPDKEAGARVGDNEAWLDRRVNEMRVKL